jgi:YegS/Rv2252/BmrU family lipid kinase
MKLWRKMSLPLVIVNPESAGGTTREAWPKIASDLATHFGAFNCTFTTQVGEGTELAAQAARKGTKLIIACGGDGTISEVANGILASGKDAELGILPSGTGGDFRRTLGIPARISDAAEILRRGRTQTIDVGRVTFVDHDGNQTTKYFLGVASFGMSAEVIKRVKSSDSAWLPTKTPKWLSGRVSFGMSMLQTAMQLPATRVIVQIDDLPERHLTVANFCVANARYFGGGMKIAPAAMLNDGKLDVVSIGDLGVSKILMNAPRLYSGTHLNMEQVGHALAKKIAARPTTNEAQVNIDVDGELVGRLPAAFQILPKALRLRWPR